MAEVMCNKVLAVQRTAPGGDAHDSPMKAWPTWKLSKSTFSSHSITTSFLRYPDLAVRPYP